MCQPIYILIVENGPFGQAVASGFASAGCETQVVITPSEALLMAITNVPSVVVYDAGMRNAQDHTIARMLRQIPETSDALFIAIANRNEDMLIPDEHLHEVLPRSTPIGDLSAYANGIIRKYRSLLARSNTAIRKTSRRLPPANGGQQPDYAGTPVDVDGTNSDQQPKGTVFARLCTGDRWTAIPASMSEKFRRAGAEVRLPSEMAQPKVTDVVDFRSPYDARE